MQLVMKTSLSSLPGRPGFNLALPSKPEACAALNPVALRRAHSGLRALPLAVCGMLGVCLLWMRPAQAQTIPGVDRGPYVQMQTTNSIMLRWRTLSPSDSQARYGTAPGQLTLAANNATNTTDHLVRISGLQPDTKYYYSIGSSLNVLAQGPDYFFTTSPMSARPTRIWVGGDNRLNSASLPLQTNLNARQVEQAFVQYAGTHPADFGLNTGDLGGLNGTDQELTVGFFNTFPELLRQNVIWVCLGNHEENTSNAEPYLTDFTLPAAGEIGGVPSGTNRYYSFTFGNIHVVSLDAQSSDVSIGGPMYNWLQQDLAANQSDWLIAYWHAPPYSITSIHNSDTETDMVRMRQNFVPLLEAHGLDLAVFGHNHLYSRTYLIDGHYGTSSTFTSAMLKDGGNGRPDGNGAYHKPSLGPAPHEGAVYAVVGDGGATLYPFVPLPAMYYGESAFGSLVIDVDGNTLNATFLRDTGATNDHFTIVKGPLTPSIVSQPKSLNTVVGWDATFTVVAKGAQPLHYQWYFNGTNLLAGATSDTLQLPNVQQPEAGNYTVWVSNSYGTVKSAVATLTVTPNVPVTIISQPQSAIALLGSTVTFSVSANGGAPLSYQWFFNGNPLAKATNMSLTLNNVQFANNGNYSVRVTNLLSSAFSSNASLTVILAPIVTVVASAPAAAEAGLAPGAFTISRLGNTSAPLTISFTVGGSATPDIDYVALTSPVTLEAGADSTNVFVLPIDDFLAESNETVIVTLAAGTGYVIGSPGSATVVLADDDNLPPAVVITRPANGAAFTAPVNIPIEALASDPDGAVIRVDYYSDGTNALGAATIAPYGITWTNAPGGTHVLTAVASDNLGARGASAPVSIYVNSPPTVSISSPVNKATFTIPANLLITATAADNVAVALVEFFVDGSPLGSRTTTPYTISWTNVDIGDYVLTARATDNEGATTFSAPVHISVREPTPDFADTFAARGLLTRYTNFVFGNNFSYTREPGEPWHAGAFGTNSGWISWTAPDSGICTMTTTTNGLTGLSNLFDTVLAVYTGSALSNLLCVASNDDDSTVEGYTAQSRVSFPAVAGTTYHAAVDAYGAGQSGNIYFRMSLATSGPTITNSPQTQVVSAGDNVTFTVGARSPVPLSYQWLLNGAAIPGATNGSCILIHAQYTNAGTYSVIVGNSLGSTHSQPAELVVRPEIVAGAMLANGSFRLVLNGTPGKQYAIETASTLPNWTSLDNVTHSSVQLEYIDTTAPAASNRVYRLRLVP